MNFRDAQLMDDARFYSFRHLRSVFPLPEWHGPAHWEEERQQIRQHLWLCSGLNSKTAAFKARGEVVRTFEHEGLVVENISIETLPGLYVQGNLYRPKRHEGKLPLILNPHGHGMNSRTVPLSAFSVPHRAMNQALQGHAAFAWSMIGYEKDSMQLEHRSLLRGDDKKRCNLLGLSLFGLQLNNSIKVLDYLCSRDDMDTDRIGCTGESGGGTQTYYLAALDDRVKVAAPVAMLSGHFQGGCECENAPLLHLKYSTVHYAALIAPRPLLLCACTGDWTHHTREREYARLRDLYRLYGKEEAIDCFYLDETHNYNRATREAVYAWMKRWLQDETFSEKSLPESGKPVPAPEYLLVFDTPVPPYENAVSTKEALIEMWERLHSQPDPEENPGHTLNLDIPEESDILIRSMTPRYAYRSKTLAQNAMTYGRFSEDSSLACHFVLPDAGKRLLVIVRDWKSENQWQKTIEAPPKYVKQWIERGNGILLPLLFGQRGTPAVRKYRRDIEDAYLYTTFNKTMHTCQAGDLVTTVKMAITEFNVPSSSLDVVAVGDMALRAFLAWAFLASRLEMGTFAGDLGGTDPGDPACWSEHAYFPLVLGSGGIKAVSRLCKGRKAFLCGVPDSCRDLFPESFRIVERSCTSAELVEALEMGK